MDESQLTTLDRLAIDRYVVLIKAERRTLESVRRNYAHTWRRDWRRSDGDNQL